MSRVFLFFTFLMLLPFRKWAEFCMRWCGRILLLGMVVFILVFAALVTSGAERSFLVESRSDTVTLTFDRGVNAWSLREAVLCEPVAVPRLGATDACGAAYAPPSVPAEQFIEWRADATVDVGGTRDGGLEVHILGGMEPEFADGSRLLVSPSGWADTGALTFRGGAEVGRDMASNVASYLHSGRWEAREEGPVTSFLRSSTEVIKTGTLATGAVVTVLREDSPAQVHGHIVPAPEGGLSVTLLSEFGDTALSIRQFGLDGAVLVKPDWVDVAVSSPLLLAIIGIITVAATANQLFSPNQLRSGTQLDKSRSPEERE